MSFQVNYPKVFAINWSQCLHTIPLRTINSVIRGVELTVPTLPLTTHSHLTTQPLVSPLVHTLILTLFSLCKTYFK